MITTIWIGIALELVAGALGTAGKQLVSYSVRISSRERARRIKFAGLAITTVLGPIADASAYAFAPQVVVAPLNGLDVVWNTLLAPYTLGERLVRGHIIGSGLVAGGAALTVYCGPPEHEALQLRELWQLFSNLSFLVYVAAFACGLTASWQTLRRFPRGSGVKARALALGGTAGCIAGNMFFLSSLLGLVRGCVEDTETCGGVAKSPVTYGMAFGAVLVAVSNVPFISRGLQEFDAVFMVPLFEGCHITIACVSGQVVLHEMHRQAWGSFICYWLSILMIVAGLVAIQTTMAGGARRCRQAEQLTDTNGNCMPTSGSNGDAGTTESTTIDTARSQNPIYSSDVGDSTAEPENASSTISLQRRTSSGHVIWASQLSGLGIASSQSLEPRGSSTDECTVG